MCIRDSRTGDHNVVRCVNKETEGEVPSGDEDGDGVCDPEDECPGVDDALCIQGIDPGCTSMPYYESVDGDVYVPMDCAPGDYDCQAREMCNFVTGEECVWQDFTCNDGGGSYYPPSTGGSSNFNFAIQYDFAGKGVIEEGGPVSYTHLTLPTICGV